MAPSSSHTSAGSVSHSTGQTKNGAIASTDTAPAATAASCRRQPARARTRSCSDAIEKSAGMKLAGMG